MLEKKNCPLTSDDREQIIRKVIENPYISKSDINKEAGITSQGIGREDVILIPWIQGNTCLVFGEKIDWQSVSLPSMRGASITPDLVGTDSQGHPVIVEVKFKFDFLGDTNHLRTDDEYKAIGQILHYDRAYKRMCQCNGIPIEVPRLFIVSIDFSKDVADVCKFLRSKGIDIENIAIEKILSK